MNAGAAFALEVFHDDFVYLTAIAVLMAVHVIHDHWYYWVAAMLMYENFVWHPAVGSISFFVGHFWTLAVEEHFYILLSLVLLLVRRYRLAVLTAAWVVLFIAFKIGESHALFDPELTARRTYWNLDYLIFPAMAAIALQRPKVREWAIRYWKPWTAFAVTLVVVALHRWSIHIRRPAMRAFSLEGWLGELGTISLFFFALWVVATMLHPRSFTTWVLELPPLRYIGRLSYSLYLWHVLFFFHFSDATNITNPVLLALGGRPAKYIAAFGAAMLSYHLVEKPLMRLGHRLAPPATPGRPELMDEPAGS